MLCRRTSPSRSTPRRAASAVEFALVAPLLAMCLFGITELGRAILVRQVLNDAVRKAARTAILPNRDNTDVTNDVNGVLTDNRITATDATVTITVTHSDGTTSTDVSTAKKGEQISVKISIPFSKVAWTPAYFMGSAAVESETLVMARQG